MTARLSVWYEQGPVGSAEASRVHEALRAGIGDELRPHPGVEAFAREMSARAAASPGRVERLDTVPGAVLVHVVDRYAEPVRAAVLQLAERHELVCFDEQAGTVHLPSTLRPIITAQADVRLEASDGEEIDYPSPADLDGAVDRLGADLWFLILHRDRRHYMQVAEGTRAGLAAGRFALEYRDGGPDRHFRCELADRAQVRTALQDYAHDRDGWRDGRQWRRLSSG